MKYFNAWYYEWVLKQELTISKIEIAKAAFEAGIKHGQDEASVDRPKIVDFSINTHKGSF